jgi:nicotinate phosphoribosyltransferase
MAHSYIEAHDDEESAFRQFLDAQPIATTLLIDTYDTERGARRVAQLVQQRRRAGSPDGVAAVRIDSGDLAREARTVRRILDEADCGTLQIVLSGGLDEHRVQSLVHSGAPVDAFGIGTSLAVPEDAPSLDAAYKLVQYAGQPRRKRSPGKETLPGRKQVVRRRSVDGAWLGDWIALEEEALEGEPLLREVMRQGRRVVSPPPLAVSRDHCRRQLGQMPGSLRALEEGDGDYPVTVSERLRALVAAMDAN